MDASFAERLQMTTIQFGPFLIAVVFHEFAHGLMARFWGDKTAQEQGRLTLNPAPHIDPIGTILFPLINMVSGFGILIGWAKPVPIDPRRFRKLRPGLFLVAFAGPLMNFLLAVISALAFAAIWVHVPDTFSLKEPFLLMCQASVSLNYALGIFNLLPLPPLDGGKIVESLLPVKAAMRYEQLAQYSFFIILALLFTGALSVLQAPILFLYRATILIAAAIFGIEGGSL